MARLPLAELQHDALSPRWSGAVQNVSVSGTSAATAVLAPGYYLVKSDVPVHVRSGAATPTAVTTDFIFESGVVYPHEVQSAGADDYLAGIIISGGSTGTMQVIKVD